MNDFDQSTKTLKLSPDVHKELKKLNAEKEHRRLNKTVKYLLKEVGEWNSSG